MTKDKLISLYYNKVKNGKLALEKVPSPLRLEVEKLLGSDE